MKKPLAFTGRIKRMCVTIFILYLIPILTIFLTFNQDLVFIYYFIVGSLIYFNYYIVYLANIINKPVEKLVYWHYKNKANRKLKSLSKMEVIAVTGSYGKTSTKNIISDILNG